MQRLQRASSSAAAKKIAVQAKSGDGGDTGMARPTATDGTTKRARKRLLDDTYECDSTPDEAEQSDAKKRKAPAFNKREYAELCSRIFGPLGGIQVACCEPPARLHDVAYHRPMLLFGPNARQARTEFLGWFDSVSEARKMPWRKPWVDPRLYQPDELRSVLERRAYEVWISEIMLQQTRVAVVIDYWNRWMERWPTIQDLARAEPEAVLSAWQGLGYYSRAARIHEAAKLVVKDKEFSGLLPETAEQLSTTIPGVGRYTAGAISAIVFGHAAPMVDGNVLRVLSRMLGIYGNVKTDKRVIDILWAGADALVKAASQDISDEARDEFWKTNHKSELPGKWGQALMELGSTVCTPMPKCEACCLSKTCRAFSEGELLGRQKGHNSHRQTPTHDAIDIEDACNLCEPFEPTGEVYDDLEADEPDPPTRTASATKTKKQSTLSSFFTRNTAKAINSHTATDTEGLLPSADHPTIKNHTKRFPLKVVKKPVRVEETLVCAIQRSDGAFLVEQRPEKGLLARMWQFISHPLPASNDSVPSQRKELAQELIDSFCGSSSALPRRRKAESLRAGIRYRGELDSIPWQFSHIKLTMHVHLFILTTEDDLVMEGLSQSGSLTRKWVSKEELDHESMGTGMRKCWSLVQEAIE